MAGVWRQNKTQVEVQNRYVQNRFATKIQKWIGPSDKARSGWQTK